MINHPGWLGREHSDNLFRECKTLNQDDQLEAFLFWCGRGWEPRDSSTFKILINCYDSFILAVLTTCDLSPLIAKYSSISFNFSFSHPPSIYKCSRKINDCPDGENVLKQTKEVLESQPGPLVSLLPNMGKISQWYPASVSLPEEKRVSPLSCIDFKIAYSSQHMANRIYYIFQSN